MYFLKIAVQFLLLNSMLLGSTKYISFSPCPLERVNTSFLQLYQDQLNRPSNEWEALFKKTRQMNITHLIIQWSSYGNTWFYTKDNPQSSLLASVIYAAQKEQLKLIIGLHYDPNFWNALADNDKQLQAYLNDKYAQQANLFPELVNTIHTVDPQGETVIGWYISDEIDDLNWQNKDRQQLLKNYLEQIVQLLKSDKNNKPIYISTYSAGKTSFEQVAKLYKFLFSINGLDKILLQDSVGTGKLSLIALEIYLLTIQSQLRGNEAKFGIITELFALKNDKENLFESASPARVFKQLELARMYTNTAISVFSLFPYALPNEPPYSELYNFWQQQLNSCNQVKNNRSYSSFKMLD